MATKKTTAKPAAKRAPVKTGVRRVALVGVNPAAKKRTVKKKNEASRYQVLVQNRNLDGEWIQYAAFRLLPHAEDYARRVHEKNASVSVKVLDTK
jgi:hypothetical protein